MRRSLERPAHLSRPGYLAQFDPRVLYQFAGSLPGQGAIVFRGLGCVKGKPLCGRAAP